MSWTSPSTVTTGQLMTAAFWNQQVRDNFGALAETAAAGDYANSRTFTNTGFLDLDALTGGAGSLSAVSVSLTTGTSAVVAVSGNMANSTAGALTILSYRISGATTQIADNDWALIVESGNAADAYAVSCVSSQLALTPGVNVFELQAAVNTGTGTLSRPHLVVTPIF